MAVVSRVVALLLLSSTVVFAREWPKSVTWKNSIVPGTLIGLDGNGRVVERVFPDGRVARQEFLENGLIARQKSPDGVSIDCGYDEKRRLTSVREGGVTRQQFFDEDGAVAGWLEGGSPAEVQHTLSALGLSGAADQRRTVVVGDASQRLKTATNGVATVRFDYGSGTLTQTLDTGRWAFVVQRLEAGASTTLFDSTGESFTYRGGAYVTSLDDAAGRRLVTRSYDERGRARHAVFAGGITIDYEYGEGMDWISKSVRGPDGRVMAVLPRRDYADPETDGHVHGAFRGPTGETIAEVHGGSIGYVAGVLVPYAHLNRDGIVEYRSFAFDSASRFTADELRVMPDGSMVVLPEVPHAEETLAARGVHPLRISVSRPQSSAHVSKPGQRSLVIAPNLYSLYESCDWIPGGSVTVDNVTSDTPGRWDCSYGWYYSPDPTPAPDPSGGGAPGGGYASGSLPPTVAETQRLNQGKSTANDRLSNNPDCAQMFTDLSANGANVIANTTYRDGTSTDKCQSSPDAGAWTEVSGSVVYLCGSQFTNQSVDEAAVIVIHEALHDAGLTENPPDTTAKTSAEISAMVRQKCGLS